MTTEARSGAFRGVRTQKMPAAETVTADDQDCGRWAKRKSSHAVVTIQSPEIARAISCTMRNSSSTGALLECSGADHSEAFARLPDNFTLYLPMERTAIDCRLVWRQYRQIGVQYTSPARVLAKPSTPARMLPTQTKKGLLARAAAKVKL